MLGACAINKVILMGRLTHDPELRQSQSGVMSCRFTVAISRPQSSNGQETASDFISVVAFNKTAEFITRNFTKGKMILVEGSIRTGSYADKNHPDVTHYTTDVWADNISFGETKSASQSTGSYSQQNSNYNRGYSAPAPQAAPAQAGPAISVGDVGDFEDILSDGDLPF